MRLQTFCKHENGNELALQFPLYLLKVDEGRLQVVKKENIELPSSVKTCKSNSSIFNKALLDIRWNYHNDIWMRERATLTDRNMQLHKIKESVRCVIHCEEQSF